jgi:hypothetical protein
MRISLRVAMLFLVTLSVTTVSASAPALATTQPKHHHARTKASHKKNDASSTVRVAQTHLAHLGYYPGHIDGLMGPKTKAGIRDFQRDQGLAPNGVLTSETRRALAAADIAHPSALLSVPVAQPNKFYATNPDFYGHVNQQFADPLLLSRGNAAAVSGASQSLPSRFAQVSITEEINGQMKRYNVTLNGEPILQVNNQPSVIGVSQTYDLGSEDVILFSTYEPGNIICPYRHHILAMNNGGRYLHPIDNCTRGYQAHVAQGSLFITFPETDDQRDIPATWRYENGDLERL